MPADYANGLNFSSAKWSVILPVSLILIDIITGLVAAWAKGNVKSGIMRQGLAKKFGELMVLLIARLVYSGFGASIAWVYGAATYICVLEFISIMENLDKLGFPIPKWIKTAFRNIKEKIDNNVNEKKVDDSDES